MNLHAYSTQVNNSSGAHYVITAVLVVYSSVRYDLHSLDIADIFCGFIPNIHVCTCCFVFPLVFWKIHTYIGKNRSSILILKWNKEKTNGYESHFNHLYRRQETDFLTKYLSLRKIIEVIKQQKTTKYLLLCLSKCRDTSRWNALCVNERQLKNKNITRMNEQWFDSVQCTNRLTLFPFNKFLVYKMKLSVL